MKTGTILRRDLLKRLATVGGAAAAWTLGGILPESRALGATPSQDWGAWHAAKIDKNAERLLALVRATTEYRNFKSALISPNPIDLWTDGDYQFVSFGVRTLEQVTQADRSPFQLYSTLTFAAGRGGPIIEVFVLRPDSDGSTSTLSGLRGGATQTVSHTPEVRAKVADARSEAIAVRESATAASASTFAAGTTPVLAIEGCDCGPTQRWRCVSTVCGGGYVNEACAWTLSLGCQFLPLPQQKVACMIAARSACYVLPYCTCGQYACGSCMY